MIVVLGVTQLLLIGPLLDARSRSGAPATAVAATLGAQPAAGGWRGGRLVGDHLVGRRALGTSAELVVQQHQPRRAGRALGLARHAAPHRRPLAPRSGRRRWCASFCSIFWPASSMAGLLLVFARVLAIAVDPATVDVRHFSLYPWNGARLLRLAGMLALQVAALWTATLVLIAARGVWRLPSRTFGVRLAAAGDVGDTDRRGRLALPRGSGGPASRRAVPVGDGLRGGGAPGATRARLVSPRDHRGAHLRLSPRSSCRRCCSTRRSTSLPSSRSSG